jgi:ATP-dependent RNA helicase RhlE
MLFEDLGICDQILRALSDKKYKEPTSIQEKAVPVILEGRDVFGCAQTGTGKTAAFSIPMLQIISQSRKHKQARPQVRGLVLTPTRELALQVAESIMDYGKYSGISYAVVFGGVKQGPQVEKLRNGVEILVATPGRLLDLLNQGLLSLNAVEFFVLDEADRMLDMGFLADIKKIIKVIPAKRQSLFFSATVPAPIMELASGILRNPVKLEASRVSSAAETIEQLIYHTNKALKTELALHIIKERDIKQLLLFARTKHGADKLSRSLEARGVNAAAIHGDKSQGQRQKALSDFKLGKLQVLVATDLAARGIDIGKLKYVMNYDLPNEPEQYVHRIGRSGRAGEKGTAISLCEPEEMEYLRDIEKLTKNKIPQISGHPFPQTDKAMTAKEKKEFEKEKQKRKQEFFAKRKETAPAGGRPFRRR